MFSGKEFMVQIIDRKEHKFKEKQMKIVMFLLSFVGILGLIVSCSSTAENLALPPVEGKLTFAFFYTDG